MIHRNSFSEGFKSLHGAGIFLFLFLSVIVLGIVPGSLAEDTSDSREDDVLVLVNGDPITAGDLDRMIMSAHRSMPMKGQTDDLGRDLLENRIKEILFIQDALYAEMDQDPDFVAMTNKNSQSFMVQEYVKDNLDLPKEVDPEKVWNFFEYNYRQVQYRQLSVRTHEEAVRLKKEVLSGANMDTLARENSLDSKKIHGGLHNLLYWADVPGTFRTAAVSVEPGELSEIFPINDAFAFIRVEKVAPADEANFPDFEKSIKTLLLGQKRQEAWDQFVADIKSQIPIQENPVVIQSILSDSTLVLSRDFKLDQKEFIFELGENKGITGGEFRRELVYSYKKETQASFRTHFIRTRDLLLNQLALSYVAKEAGYDQDPDVLRRLDEEWEERLLRKYNQEVVASGLEVKQEDISKFYDEYAEEFRGPGEVRLDILILKSKEDADEASSRLRNGADFSRVYSEFNHGQQLSPSKPKFIKETELSKEIREELAGMAPGASSHPISMGMGFMVFKLDARRQGAIAPLPMVVKDIRKVLVKKEFERKSKENLELLKDNSEIVVNEDRLQAYYSTGGEE